VVRNLVRVTELCGGGLADVVAVRAYLVDWADYQVFNDAYARWFPDRLPNRTCLGTTGLAVGALVVASVAVAGLTMSTWNSSDRSTLAGSASTAR
jgi:enamine deaminase RidA (YjgF/YER057c/UK114 family)